MEGNETNGNSHHSMGNSHIVLTAQLYKAVATVHHVDEIFLWLVRAFVSSFDIEIAQCWVVQDDRVNQHFIQLRQMVEKSHLLPLQMIANNQMASIVGQLQNTHNRIVQKEVEGLFPPYQAKLLTRYGLRYCTCYFHRNPALFLPVQQGSTDQDIQTPLNLTILLFSRRSHPEHMLATINLICERAIQAAGARGFLLPAEPIPTRRPQTAPLQSSGPLAQLNRTQLIPHRLENDALLKSSSPFASSALISDKLARRLYGAIDGTKDVGELQSNLHMDSKEFFHALNFLLSQQRIQLFEPDGQSVASSPFLQT